MNTGQLGWRVYAGRSSVAGERHTGPDSGEGIYLRSWAFVRADRAPTSGCRLTSVPSSAMRRLTQVPPQSALDDDGFYHRTRVW